MNYSPPRYDSLVAGNPDQGRFTPLAQDRHSLLDAITSVTRLPEPEALAGMLEHARMDPDMAARSRAGALRLARSLRARPGPPGMRGLTRDFLRAFSLSTEEGVALMCLAEALLRIPDATTRHALIRDTLRRGRWLARGRHRQPLFVHAASWGLWLTGRVLPDPDERRLSRVLQRVLGRCSQAVIGKAMDLAMRTMGEQFIAGRTIDEALEGARTREAAGFGHSYDMLGEAAMTALDAARYRHAYAGAIRAIGRVSAGAGVYAGPGVSIKLSALHPRYQRAQHQRVMSELYPALRELCLLACQHDIGLTIDAEESDRLELSLELLEKLCFEPQLAGWDGLGFVVQAYQKRSLRVIDYLLDLATRSDRRLMVRLVKGAYWDSEIKRAQVLGLSDYPVFTCKEHTDVSYLACARRLLDGASRVYPQFATHNAHTVAAIGELAAAAHTAPEYEFQCLYGMGEALYEPLLASDAADRLRRPCRIYAPVGDHETLLPYLVRRLLENGANTSFINHVSDPSVPLEALVADPVARVLERARATGRAGLAHPSIPLPEKLYGTQRVPSRGLDLADEAVLTRLSEQLQALRGSAWMAAPMLADGFLSGPTRLVSNPADHRDRVGHVQEATPRDVDVALAAATADGMAWGQTPPRVRAQTLDAASDLLEQDMPHLIGLLQREAGKTAANAVDEVREAVDFLRYYAALVRNGFNTDTCRPLGPVACISPWNFPLAIFTGQVAAALAAGNPVLAKPAEQTPLVAAHVVRRLYQAGIPRPALQLLPGRGDTVGARLVADPRILGVMFTGSTEVARLLQKNTADRLDAAGRPITLIAETGGQNAMLVDASALPEQVVADVITSAFDSAGQRCSALRLLCLQEETADRVLAMIRGAMAECRVGDPGRLDIDVGPVIDADARDAINRHIERMRARGRSIHQVDTPNATSGLEHGTFVPPTLIEIDHVEELGREVFGPVLHVLRYRRNDLPRLLDAIRHLGYGLTLGLHSRIDSTLEQVIARSDVGNLYVNRNMVGAVVGVQPFGGRGLSGTGPKAGGPLYLFRLLSARPDAAPRAAIAGCDDAMDPASHDRALRALRRWATQHRRTALASCCERFARLAPGPLATELDGPTGERNVYSTHARSPALCVANHPDELLVQLAAICAVGGRAVWPAAHAALLRKLPRKVRERVRLTDDSPDSVTGIEMVLHHGDRDERLALLQVMARRVGAIVPVLALQPGEHDIPLERLVSEQALSINTTASGGNASLLSMDAV